ncbi:MAG: hypothetical protein QGG90_03095, partial [Nitrospinota bacterium]|nr:hypothetical protein [Nitrospinota bacterium]
RYTLKGHGLGTTKFRDLPRPVEKDYVLRPGETVNFESILLDERFGCATLEDTVRITETGREVLSRCEHRGGGGRGGGGAVSGGPQPWRADSQKAPPEKQPPGNQAFSASS